MLRLQMREKTRGKVGTETKNWNDAQSADCGKVLCEFHWEKSIWGRCMWKEGDVGVGGKTSAANESTKGCGMSFGCFEDVGWMPLVGMTNGGQNDLKGGDWCVRFAGG